jgi:uncharacterized protein with NRDE domain
MCLILFAYQHHPRYPLILAANRDEFFNRPTQALAFWPDQPGIAAGRDLKRMGTWLGLNRHGRLAAVTNYREAGVQRPEARSRGHLVADFLVGNTTAPDYLRRLHANGHRYNGFNLIMGDARELHYYSNRGVAPTPVQPGIHGLSNHLLDTPWPKVCKGQSKMAAILAEDDTNIDRQRLLEALEDQSAPPDDQLPDTGLGAEWERMLAPIFITSPDYGTRCSSLLTINTHGEVHFTEITWQPAASRPILKGRKHIQFKLHPYVA